MIAISTWAHRTKSHDGVIGHFKLMRTSVGANESRSFTGCHREKDSRLVSVPPPFIGQCPLAVAPWSSARLASFATPSSLTSTSSES